MALPPDRPNSPPRMRYGAIGQNAEWREIVSAYYWDRMEFAYAQAQELGPGFRGVSLAWFRMIEGEALTREKATLVELTDWLTVEFNAEEIILPPASLELIHQTCLRVGARLNWDFSGGVRVTVLPFEADAPWHGARAGYCVDKYPYDKICVPLAAAEQDDRLRAVVSHEFTHVITLNRTQGRIPHWLDEGLAMLMENAQPSPPHHWLDPNPLNAAFEVDRRDPSGLSYATEAYYQSFLLVRKLHEMGGDEKLAQLMGAFTNNSLLTEIRINLMSEPSVEEALHEVYGISQAELFQTARPS